MTLNTVKKRYKEAIKDQIDKLPDYNKVTIHYKLFPKTKHLTDIGNVTAVHKKFFEDALVECGHLPDDNYNYVIGSSESFGHIDKDNPRVEITITEVE